MSASADEFETFWRAYPRRTAKGDARKAWERATKRRPGLLAACLSALAWQVTQPQWVRDDGAYVPYPATWLNREEWDNECPQTAAAHVAQENFEAWQRANAHDPAAKLITLEQFVNFSQTRRRA